MNFQQYEVISMVSGSQDYTQSVLNDLNDLSDLGKTEHAIYIERKLIRQASPDDLYVLFYKVDCQLSSSQ